MDRRDLGWPHLPLRLQGEGGCDCCSPGVVTGRGVPCLPAALCPKQLPGVVPNCPFLPPPRSHLMGWHPDGIAPYPWPSAPALSQPPASLSAVSSLRASTQGRAWSPSSTLPASICLAPSPGSAWGCLQGGCSRGWCCPELSTGWVITEPRGWMGPASSQQPAWPPPAVLALLPILLSAVGAASRHRDFLLNNTSPSGACLSRKLHHYPSNWLRELGFVKALQKLTGVPLFWPSRCWQNIR